MDATTSAPGIPIDQEVDYTKLVEEYQPRNWSLLPANPYYATADGYFELNSMPVTNVNGKDVELTPENCRGRQTYVLKSEDAYYKVSDI